MNSIKLIHVAWHDPLQQMHQIEQPYDTDAYDIHNAHRF